MLIKNPRTPDVTKYIDCELWLGEIDDNGDPVEGKGRWVPHTTLPGEERYESLYAEEAGPIEILPAPRRVRERYEEALARGVLWNGVRLKVDDPNIRERISSAAIRMNVNNTLPLNKGKLSHPTVPNGSVDIHKKDIIDVSMLIQDYVEQCNDNYQLLLSDETLDPSVGWPQ